MQLRDEIQKSQGIIVLYIGFLIGGGILISSVDKISLHLTVNAYHAPIFDYIFRYVTKLGEPIAIGSTVLGMAYWVSRRAALAVLLSNALSGIVIFTLKYWIFDAVDRPKAVLQGVGNLYYVSGVSVHLHNSFPSGHTAAAFATYVALLLMAKRRYMKWVWFALPVSVGLSRIYLSQHFFIDTYFGSIVGTITAWIAYRYYLKNIA